MWFNEVSNVVLQQALRNLDTAYQNFFQKRAKYPGFKSNTARSRPDTQRPDSA